MKFHNELPASLTSLSAHTHTKSDESPAKEDRECVGVLCVESDEKGTRQKKEISRAGRQKRGGKSIKCAFLHISCKALVT